MTVWFRAMKGHKNLALCIMFYGGDESCMTIKMKENVENGETFSMKRTDRERAGKWEKIKLL